MKEIEEYVQNYLFANQDLTYRAFNCKLIPTINPEAVIGVRTPVLRKFSKELAKMPESREFLNSLPHKYYEENNLHGFLVENIKDYDACIAAVEEFLPYIDNWATCDLMAPKIFKKHLPELLEKIKLWLKSDRTYTIRFAIGMLLSFYLDSEFKVEYLDLVASVRSEEYYVNMMIAWYFATALAKQYDAALLYIEEQRLDRWTHNKAIQKAIESYRISEEKKGYLRTKKIKSK
ncbi:DNA alkylation repair protein [Alloiococcus sp. CFN-8]|uniref:DNA alkylation repair protein n=1 Tax=Alloiococcus sp. CFN-8 TaxID=3416081 RepID=UPI003CFAE9B5